jgi:hypothetical protein
MFEPLSNAEFLPGPHALTAAAFAGILNIRPGTLHTRPAIEHPIQSDCDARLFPGVCIEFFTHQDLLVPVQRGQMVAEQSNASPRSYWRVIPQIGKVWRETADGGWSRGAFPLTLVNDTENHAHQGLARFLFREGQVRDLVVQFVQQTAPYLLGRHFVAWGSLAVDVAAPSDARSLESRRLAVAAEIAGRLPAQPESRLGAAAECQVICARVRDGTLYFQESYTPYGAYPYPLEMRLGVRSVMKSVGAPLALLRLAQTYGPEVLTLSVGDYVPGLDPKWKRVRLLDAANMATGFGGTGSVQIRPNDIFDGYLGGDYDGWYVAGSHAQKVAHINAHLRPYPWEPGKVMRYRDQDFYLLGAALQEFLRSIRGPAADLWDMLQAEVFAPIGIQQAPTVRTRDGLVWLNAGYYPTLDDLAKIAILYQARGAHGGQQILHRQLTSELLEARDAVSRGEEGGLYKMGFHFVRHADPATGEVRWLPKMWGSGESEIILYPDGSISIVIGKVYSGGNSSPKRA